MDFYTAGITLFLVMDPLGNIPFFLSTLKPVPESRRRRVMLRELLIAYAFLLTFLFTGPFFLRLLNLRQEAISIAGGLVLFLIALRMIFPADRAPEDAADADPLVVPLAIPGVAGPSSLATVLLMVRSSPGRLLEWSLAVSAAWAATALILMASPWFFRLLKARGLVAMERLMGMLLVAMSVQMFLDGIGHALKAMP